MSKTSILAVDDEALNLEILVEYFADESEFSVDTADSGEAAWARLQIPEHTYQLILLDRMMPGMDGIELLGKIKADPRLACIPVIMQTAAGGAEQIRQGLEAGAYYYLTKPYRRDALMAIAHAALADASSRNALREQLKQHVGSLRFMQQADFSIYSIDEATQLAGFIAQACPNPEIAVIGISELLVNGVEHGNLGLSYAEKSSLKLDDQWQQEIQRRSALPENQHKRVCLSYRHDADRITLRIADEGAGFEWAQFLEMSPERAFDPNGRGIALARMMSFSQIHYEGNGNVAVATILCNTTNEQER